MARLLIGGIVEDNVRKLFVETYGSPAKETSPIADKNRKTINGWAF